MSRASIERTLLAGSAIGIAVVLAVAGLTLDRGMARALLDELDDDLEHEVALFGSTIKLDPEGLETDFGELAMPEFEETEGPAFLQLLTARGDLVHESVNWGTAGIEWEEPLDPPPSGHSVPGENPASSPAPEHEEPPLQLSRSASGDLVQPAEYYFPGRQLFGRTSSGQRVRALVLAFRPIVEIDAEMDEVDRDELSPETLVLTVARSTQGIDELLSRLRLLLMAVGTVAGALSLTILAVIVRHSLRPLESLAEQIRDLSEFDLSRRISLPETPREIETVVERLNDLLFALEQAFARERRFTADIAHEIRTPLAGLRTTLEVQLSRPRTAEEHREVLLESMEIVLALQEMTQTMLELAHLESGQARPEREEIELAELVQSSWTPLAQTAEKKGLRTTFDLEPVGSILTDSRLLGTAIRNILENAVEHSDEGGEIRTSIRREGPDRVLSVRNSGSQVGQDEVENLFERFTLRDSARSATGIHCGLGLSLVREIALSLGATTTVLATRGGDFEFQLRLDGVGTGRP